jgi:hypothetical protein
VLRPPFYLYLHGQAPGHDELVEPCFAGLGAAIVGMAFYGGARYPKRLRGALFYADFQVGCVYAMLADAAGIPDPSKVEVFARGIDQAVAFEIGPDGDLFYLSHSGALHRLHYEPPRDDNRGPEHGAEPFEPRASDGDGGCKSTRPTGWISALLLLVALPRRRAYV